MADVINATEETALRAEVQKWYNDICSIVRLMRSPDGHGGQAEARTTIATGVRCDIAAGTNQARPTEVIAAQIEARQTYTVSLPPGTDVKVHDRIIVTSRGNKEMVVQEVMAPESWDLELNIVASLEGEPLV